MWAENDYDDQKLRRISAIIWPQMVATRCDG